MKKIPLANRTLAFCAGAVAAVACSSDGATVSSNGLLPDGSSPDGWSPPGACPEDSSSAPGKQLDGVTIPSAHPRLWWTADRIARAKVWLAAHPFSPRSDDYIGQAFLHVVSGADCKSAIRWDTGFTISDSELQGVASDNSRWHGEEAIVVYDWCYDQLSAGDKSTLLPRWDGYIGKTMTHDWGGPKMPGSNYFWGYLRNELEWAFATQGESAKSASFLDDALVKRWNSAFVPFAAGAGSGGIPPEGPQYGAYLATYPVVGFATAGLHGRKLYDESDFFKGTVFYALYATTPALTTSNVDQGAGFDIFPFNEDETWSAHDSASRLADFMAQSAMTWRCLPVGKLARGWLALVGATASPAIASVDRGGEVADPSTLPRDYYAPGLKYFYGRNEWKPSSTTFQWQLGDFSSAGVGHYHFDYGTFQIWRHGRWLTRESVGYSENYTGFGGKGGVGSETTFAHNALLIGGNGFAMPSDRGVDGPPVVQRLESQAQYAYADVDLTKSYRNGDPSHPERDNPAAGHIEREFVFVRALETTVILDRMVSNAAGGKSADNVTKTFLIHFEKSPTLADAAHVNYASGDQALQLSILVPTAPSAVVVDERSAGGRDGQFRLELTTYGAAQSYFLTVLQARDAAATPLLPTVVEDATTFTVKLDASTSLVFNKGATGVGGSIVIRGNKTAFRADVQGTKLTDAGPAWL